MLNAMRDTRTRKPRVRQHLEGERDCGVTNRVHGGSNAAVRSAFSCIAEDIRIEHAHAALISTLIRFPHPGSA